MQDLAKSFKESIDLYICAVLFLYYIVLMALYFYNK